MNKHIELVKKWLNDPSSVTKEELKANRASAAVSDRADAVSARAAAEAARADADSAYWVKRYEELIK